MLHIPFAKPPKNPPGPKNPGPKPGPKPGPPGPKPGPPGPKPGPPGPGPQPPGPPPGPPGPITALSSGKKTDKITQRPKSSPQTDISSNSDQDPMEDLREASLRGIYKDYGQWQSVEFTWPESCLGLSACPHQPAHPLHT